MLKTMTREGMNEEEEEAGGGAEGKGGADPTMPKLPQGLIETHLATVVS